jgi:hypothetical protein
MARGLKRVRITGKNKTLSARVPEEFAARFNVLAAQHQMSPSDFVRLLAYDAVNGRSVSMLLLAELHAIRKISTNFLYDATKGQLTEERARAHIAAADADKYRVAEEALRIVKED